jgi:hypothetical protein
MNDDKKAEAEARKLCWLNGENPDWMGGNWWRVYLRSVRR